MSAGWMLTHGEIKKYYVSEDELWSTFNFVFSDACAKRSTYKYGLIKAILDNLLSVNPSQRGLELSYQLLFSKFAENYWNLVTKYHLNQMRKSTTSSVTKLEQIFQKTVSVQNLIEIDYEGLSKEEKNNILQQITNECKKNVIGALYANFDGILYGFDLKDSGIWINPIAYEFMLKYKTAIEQLNYYSWAKFLEKINDDSVLTKVLDKLELSTPRRKDLSIYREILKCEFENNNCFYCGKKLIKTTHVDHVIPWSFVKEDHLWNFVLSCPECNVKKNNHIPDREGLTRVILRNEQLTKLDNPLVKEEFTGYSPDLMWKIWDYAKLSGMRVFKKH